MVLRHPNFQRITVDSDVCFGKPCIRGMRMPVSSILDYLSSGMTNDEILAEFPFLELEDILEALSFSSLLLQDRFIPLKLAS